MIGEGVIHERARRIWTCKAHGGPALAPTDALRQKEAVAGTPKCNRGPRTSRSGPAGVTLRASDSSLGQPHLATAKAGAWQSMSHSAHAHVAIAHRNVEPPAAVHRWHTSVLGFSPSLVAHCLERLEVGPGDLVLDPFCGLGTTLVECKRRGIHSVGLDASPAAAFVTRAKLRWRVSSSQLLQALNGIVTSARRDIYLVTDGPAGRATIPERELVRLPRSRRIAQDVVYRYLASSGMIERGWVADRPARKLVRLRMAIEGGVRPRPVSDILMLGLLATAVRDASNVRFGPELYCTQGPADVDVLRAFGTRVRDMATDLKLVTSWRPHGRHHVMLGDAREVGPLLEHAGIAQIDAVITSPPYPAEHDYTRNTRLELALLGEVTSRERLRVLKRSQIRSHTKGIYKADDDDRLVADVPGVTQLRAKLDRRARGRTDGFARLYSKVIGEYFGGMLRHLQSLSRALPRGARLAYVVGDQQSYLGVHVPTARVLADLANGVPGLRVTGMEEWRRIRSNGRARRLMEHVLYLRRI